MQVGYLTHVASLGGPAHAFRQTIELAVLAEELGFDSFWLAQHHGGAFDGQLPAPLVLLAAIAERTSTIKLGTGVVAAPLEDPVRLAEDAATLDVLADGRVQLGIGAGADPVASKAFGRDHDRRHRDCLAVVDELCTLLDGDRLVPTALGLRDRLWWATGSPTAVDHAAGRGIGVITGRPTDAAGSTVTADLDRYWSRVVTEPRVAVSRLVQRGEPAARVISALRADPALPWATELILQTQPILAGFAEQSAVLRMLAAELVPGLRRTLVRG